MAEDYARGAERAHTHDPMFDRFLAEKATSARELVTELVASLDYDRPGYAPGLLSSELHR